VFDDDAFSDASFERSSWLMDAVTTARREVVRLISTLALALTLQSRL
jgi:hypothetical protein